LNKINSGLIHSAFFTVFMFSNLAASFFQ